MAWPCREDLWHVHLAEAKAEYAATAKAIARFEPVTMVVNPSQADEARSMLDEAVDLVIAPIDDSWLRDAGPIYTVDQTGGRTGVDFVFNSWGEKYVPYDKDAAIAEVLLDTLGHRRHTSPMVLEGGAITVDGEGTLITTEQCLLHPNRNPTMSRADIEAELGRCLGIEKVIWLPWGHFDDRDTDGHVDGVCTFVRPGVVLAHTEADTGHPDFERMNQNLDVLRSSTDARGRQLEVIELPPTPTFELSGETYATAYANFYVANGGVIVPVAGVPEDEAALDRIRDAFPDREVVGVISRVIALGGGGTHCITQQVPAG